MTYRRTSTSSRWSHASTAARRSAARLGGNRERSRSLPSIASWTSKRPAGRPASSPCSGMRAEQQPGRPPVVDDRGEDVQTSEVDVAGRDRQADAARYVADQVSERRRVA